VSKKEEDEILARELGKLGAFGGASGRDLGGALEGGPVAALAASMLPDNTFELNTEISAPPSDVLKKAFSILRQLGRITEGVGPPSDLPTVYAVVGSGFWNLNPAWVRIEIVPISKNLTKVSVRGTAKEGLIKQRAGEKAAKRIVDLLNQAFSTAQD
jgi:hypothetical protein